MHTNEIRAYEGKEPFIFISYAHKDSDRVMPILAKLQQEGYRVWYDEGIAPGSEWPENIAQHLNDCAVTIAMVSANSMNSPNCRREITYALSKHKPFLGIFLEETAMSPGMELQMSAQQCLMKYSYRTEELFYEKVASCPDLAPCKQEPEVLPTAFVAAAVPAPQKPVQAEKAPAKTGKKLWIPIAAAAAVVALALVILLIAGGGGGNSPTDPEMNTSASDPTEPTGSTAPTKPSQGTKPTEPTGSTQGTEPTESIPTITVLPGHEVEQDALSLFIYNETITADAIAQINKLRDLITLCLDNCVFEPGVLAELDAPNLTLLQLDYAQGIEDFHFLTTMPKLYQLFLPGVGVTDSNFPWLDLDDLYKIDLSDNPGFSDLTLLEGSENLSHVYCSNTGVTNLAPLANLESLTCINFSGCNLGTITETFYSLYLEQMYLANCGLTDISGLLHMTVLTAADLSNNLLEDVSFLEKSAATLKTVCVSYNPLEAEDLQFLSKCKSVTELRVSGIALGDLSICQNMSNVKILEASHCQLTSTSGLSVLGKLQFVQLSYNCLTEFGLGAFCFDGDPIVDLSYNDLQSLPATTMYYTLLNLAGNDHLVFTNRVLKLQGDYLFVSFHESLLECVFNFYGYYVMDCPMDQIVNVNNKFGKSSVTILKSQEELLTVLREKGLSYP